MQKVGLYVIAGMIGSIGLVSFIIAATLEAAWLYAFYLSIHSHKAEFSDWVLLIGWTIYSAAILTVGLISLTGCWKMKKSADAIQ